MGRMDRVNQLMKREIGSMIQKEFEDPRLQFITITNVTVSPDLQVARVSYSVLGDESQLKAVENALNRSRGYIRKMIGKRIRLKNTPAIEFVYDKSIEYSARIDEKLQEIQNELSQRSKDNKNQ